MTVSPNPSSPEMITERARVLRVAGDTAWVQCESQAGCARCAAGEGCGGGLFARLLRGRLQELPVALAGSDVVHAGDGVLIGLSTSAVQRASFLMYGLPLLALILGSLAGDFALGNDAAALLGGVIAAAGAFAYARHRAVRDFGDGRLQPVLLRTLRPGEPCPAAPEA